MAAAPRNSVRAGVARDLAALAAPVRTCAEAAAARVLAQHIDDGVRVEACSRELRAVMAVLRSRGAAAMSTQEPPAPSTQETEGASRVGDLASRIAARRGAAAG